MGHRRGVSPQSPRRFQPTTLVGGLDHPREGKKSWGGPAAA